MLASVEIARGRNVEALLEAVHSLLPARPGRQTAWAPIAFKLQRMMGGIAQHEQRHADAIDAFAAALGHLPTKLASPDVMGVRLQVLGRLARSRLALGHYVEVESEAKERQSLIEALHEKIPVNARTVLSSGVLADIAAAQAMTNRIAESDRGFAKALQALEGLGTGDLGEVKRQILDAWTAALVRNGRHEDVNALRNGSLPRPGQNASLEGAAHNHDHHHAHAHDHAKGGCSCCH
jgi:hypothetical protein